MPPSSQAAQPNATAMRVDIQWLRAVAVLSVLLYHLRPPRLPSYAATLTKPLREAVLGQLK